MALVMNDEKDVKVKKRDDEVQISKVCQKLLLEDHSTTKKW